MPVPHKIILQNEFAPVYALENLGIPVSGPFVTPNDLWLYVVDGCIITRSELRALHATGQLTAEHIATVLCDLRRLQTA
ncbi:MAG: hypothetical protein WCE61_14720 [Candidatus Acidiferrum sp.]